MKTKFEELPRLLDFRMRTKFKQRARKSFRNAYHMDSSSVSNVIKHLTHAVYCYDQISEYGTTQEEKEREVLDQIEQLPRRFRFLNDYSHFIAEIKY